MHDRLFAVQHFASTTPPASYVDYSYPPTVLILLSQTVRLTPRRCVATSIEVEVRTKLRTPTEIRGDPGTCQFCEFNQTNFQCFRYTNI